MRALHGSGGSTKGAGIIGAWNALRDSGYKPDIISGVSVSAVLAVPFAIGKGYEAARVMTTLNLDSFWKVSPVSKKGSFTFRSLIRILRGKSLGDQSELRNAIKNLVNRDEFEMYKAANNPAYPYVVTMSVDLNTGRKVFTNMKTVSYDKFLDYTVASASIPVYAMPVKIKGMNLYDGGVRDHIISKYILENYPITESISIYSREEGLSALDTDTEKSGIQTWKPRNYHFDALNRVMELLNYEISKGDEKEEDRICAEKRIKNLQIFLPKVLNSLYDTNNKRLKTLHDWSAQIATREYRLWTK